MTDLWPLSLNLSHHKIGSLTVRDGSYGDASSKKASSKGRNIRELSFGDMWNISVGHELKIAPCF